MADVIRLETRRRRGAWRAAVGGVLREWRTEQGLRLADVAERAGVSTQYLSEVERGRKEASSEVLGAVTEALGSSLSELALGVADGLREPSALNRTTNGAVTLLAA
jgi:transcriptional regulator with XRE-family HTH domain